MKEYYNANGIPPGEPTMKGSNADPYVADVALPNAELGDYSVPTDWPTNVKFNEPGDVPGPVVQFEDDDQGDVKAGYGFESDNLYEGDWFFFHTDHLGSTSYLTDTAGNVSQFVCYTPYGEAIVDEHLTTYENPFKFSGKELDDITGLYDHGARSRNPISTLWYGIDPLFEKYTEFSPYNYCAGNPVKLVDPDGRVIVFSDARTQSLFYQEMKKIEGNEKLTRYYKSLVSSKLTYTIQGTPKQAQFVAKRKDSYSPDYHSKGMEYNDKNHFLGVEFDFSVTMYNKNNPEITWPTVAVLNHEFTHAAQFDACVRIFDFGEDPNIFADIVPELLSDDGFNNGDYSGFSGPEVYNLVYSIDGMPADTPTEKSAIQEETDVTKYVNPQFKYEKTRDSYTEGKSVFDE